MLVLIWFLFDFKMHLQNFNKQVQQVHKYYLESSRIENFTNIMNLFKIQNT